MSEFHRALAELLEAGIGCASATLVDATGSTPAKAGHHLIVPESGPPRFTMGGGPLEAEVIADCRRQLAAGANALREYHLVPGEHGGVGMVCGGTVRVFIEVHPAPGTLLVFGGGHVGAEVIRMAEGLGFARAVADDREEWLEAQRFGPGVRRHHCPDAYAGELPATDERTRVVIVTRCHATDREILARLARRPRAYLGMIGSRRKVESVLGELEERGLPRSLFRDLRAPIGLDIGARTPREIALAILAEIVAERNAPERAARLARPRTAAGAE